MNVTLTLYIDEGDIRQVDAVFDLNYRKALGRLMLEMGAKAVIVQREDGTVLLDSSKWVKPWQKILLEELPN